jgi:uncharacterized membrane protein YphA (DoxX/SURF4 family)
VIVAASVLLGALFLAAGVTKVAAPQQWRAQSAELGVPAAVATVMPYVELSLGALLIAQLARRPVAVVAGLLLIAFTVLLVVRLLQGRRPPCACFGVWMANPIGWSNVARNSAFIALALIVVLGS